MAYDFAVELKKRHKEIKDKPASEVGYSLKYIPWILQETANVYRKHHKRYDFNELLSVAFTATLDAEKKYKPEGREFTSYARKYVEGAFNDYVSGVSKSQRKLQTKIKKYSDDYYKSNNAYPSKQMILSTLEISETSFANLVSKVDIKYVDDLQESALVCTQDPTSELLVDEIHNVIDYIDVDYNGILRMYIIEELPFNLIGDRLGMTKNKVQGLYDKALLELRDELSNRAVVSKEDIC